MPCKILPLKGDDLMADFTEVFENFEEIEEIVTATEDGTIACCN